MPMSYKAFTLGARGEEELHGVRNEELERLRSESPLAASAWDDEQRKECYKGARCNYLLKKG
jgi:hypothetical protein